MVPGSPQVMVSVWDGRLLSIAKAAAASTPLHSTWSFHGSLHSVGKFSATTGLHPSIEKP